MGYEVLLTKQADEDLAGLPAFQRGLVDDALDRLAEDPRDPRLASHKYETVTGPKARRLWDSHLDDGSPDGLRIWWWFGPEPGQVTILAIGPHPG